MAGAYAVFANGGYQVASYLIDRIQDWQGKVVYEAKPKVAPIETATQKKPDENGASESSTPAVATLPQLIGDKAANPVQTGEVASAVISPQIAYLVTTVLQDVVKVGTGKQAAVLNRPDIAGKTGTTNEKVDAWFCGFNKHLVTTTVCRPTIYSRI